MDLPRADSGLEIDRGNFTGRIDAFDDPRIVRRQDLATRGPVRFEAIVRRRVVRGRDHHTRVTAFGNHGERQLGCGPRLGKEEDLETVSRQDASRSLSELSRTMTRIKRDGRARRETRLQQVVLLTPTLHIDRQSVGRLGNGPIIDRGGTEVAHRPAPSARSER